MELLKAHLKERKPQNVVILSGAGVSTNAGLPDYRGNTGDGLLKLFATTKDIYAEPLYQTFMSKLEQANPTPSHYLALYLYKLGILRRVYTQNIDGLYRRTGLPEDKIVEFHGSIARQDIVMYGKPISSDMIRQVIEDFVDNPIPIDLVIVMGTALQAAPFCALPNLVPKSCCRLLVDRNPSNAFTNSFTAKRSLEAGENRHNQNMKIGRRRVTLKSSWSPRSRSKWNYQYVITDDVDSFSNKLINLLDKQ